MPSRKIISEKITMEIKKLTDEYVSAVAEIEKSCFSNPWNEAAIKAELNNHCSEIYIAVDENGTAEGYVNIYTVLDEMDIVRVAVMPNFRRQGVAKKMLEAALKEKQGTVYLDVRESNFPAISLYKSLGFKDTGVRKNYYTNPTENAVLMERIKA